MFACVMCTNVMCVDIMNKFFFFYLFHEIANMLFFSHLLTNIYMNNWATLLMVLVALYNT